MNLGSTLTRLQINVVHATEVAVDAVASFHINASEYRRAYFEVITRVFRSCARDYYLESGSCRSTCHDGFYPDKTGNYTDRFRTLL